MSDKAIKLNYKNTRTHVIVVLKGSKHYTWRWNVAWWRNTCARPIENVLTTHSRELSARDVQSVKFKFALSLHKGGTMYHMIYFIIIICKCGSCPVFDELYPGICLTTEGKTRKKPQGSTIHNKENHNHKSIQNITIHTTISKTTHFTVYCNKKP